MNLLFYLLRRKETRNEKEEVRLLFLLVFEFSVFEVLDFGEESYRQEVYGKLKFERSILGQFEKNDQIKQTQVLFPFE
jgi:hypothetical protein